MYQLIEDVYPYLIGFFLLDGLIRVRGDQVAFIALWGARIRRRGPGVYAYGLLPTAEVVLAADLPLLLDTQGLHHLAGEGAWVSIPHEAIRGVEARGRSVAVAAETSAQIDCASRGRALRVAADIESVRRASPAERPEVLDRLDREASDVAGLRARCSDLSALVTPLRILSSLLGSFFLVLLPAGLYYPGQAWRPAVPWLVLAILLLHASVVALSVRLLRRCGHRSRVILEALAPLLLFPPGSIHALSLVLRDGYLRFASPACAVAWLDPTVLVPLARRELRRLGRTASELQGAVLAAHARRQAHLWHRSLAAAGIEADHDPVRCDPTAASYCPACLAEYRQGFEECSDCREPLAAYTSDPAALA